MAAKIDIRLPWNPRLGSAPKLLSGGLADFAPILYRVWSHDTRQTFKATGSKFKLTALKRRLIAKLIIVLFYIGVVRIPIKSWETAVCAQVGLQYKFSQNYLRGVGRLPPVIFTGVKNAKYGHNFRLRSTTLDFEPLSFRNGVIYLKSNFNQLRFGSMIALCSGHIWRSSIYSLSASSPRCLGPPPPEKRQKHFPNH